MQTQEMLKRIKSKQPPTVVDVRSGREYRNGHISGALHAPTWKILLRLACIPSNKDTELVVTCEHGLRAQMAKGLLGSLGYRKVELLEGHMSAWRQAGHHQEK